MKNSKLFEPVSFADVYSYLEKKDHKKFKVAVKSIIGVGALLFPMHIAPILGLSSAIVSDYATGATLAGAGVGQIVGDAIKSIAGLFPKKMNYKDRYMQMQIAFYLCLYAAFYDAVEKYLVVEGHDIWKGHLIFIPKKIKCQEDNEETLQKFNLAKSVDCSNDEEIQSLYTVLTEEFKNHFYSLDFWNDLGTSCEAQREYYDGVFQKLASKAFYLFKQQISGLSESFPSMRNWVIERSLDSIGDQLCSIKDSLGGLDKQVKDIPNNIKKVEMTRQIKHKDLYRTRGNKFYTFFEDGCCNIDRMFILSNYVCGSADIEEKQSKINNIEEIMDIASEQRFLLIAGVYGSGKTTLIKALHKKYRLCGILVYVFDACELVDIVNEESATYFIDFFDSIVGDDETIVLIDAVDDLNIPNSRDSETSLLNFFLQNMYACIEQINNIIFIISSRLYSYAHEGDGNLITETCYYLAPANLTDMRVIYSKNFDSIQVGQWIESYPFKENKAISKTDIKEKNGELVSPLYNPLFLYIFMKEYDEIPQKQTKEEEKKEEEDKGYYDYYEHFINQTIKGKYVQEAQMGAKVIRNHAKKYRQLLQQLSFDILNHYSEKINSIIEKEKRFSNEPLLADELQKYHFSISLTDFSETTKTIYVAMESEEIDKANFINCYFLRMVREQIFFTDANILFILTAERTYNQMWEVIRKNHIFSLSDFQKIDVIDFYPQILDYILFKIRKDKRVDKFMEYVNSFVTNDDIRNRMIGISNLDKGFKEIFAQIIMFYIIFIRLNEKGYISNGYEHLFRELMYYVNAYKTFCYNNKKINYVYTVEPYFMNICLKELSLKRTNLKAFNFKSSTIENCNFLQCKLNNTILEDVIMIGKNKFELCTFSKIKFKLKKDFIMDEIYFFDCTFKEVNYKFPRGRFVRCYIQNVIFDLNYLQELKFVDCVIDKISLVGSGPASARMEFSSCMFKTAVDLQNYIGKIEFTSKCLDIKGSGLFKHVKNPQRVPSSDMIV